MWCGGMCNLNVPQCTAPIFTVENLTIAYADRKGRTTVPLRDFNLSIAANEITCLLGPSGCGKSTLLKALGGFVTGKNTGGVIYQNAFLKKSVKDIVMIFQDNNLFPWLNVGQNIGFGQRYHQGETSSRKEQLEKMIETVGLQDAVARYPHQLSGGMKQRTAIARALVVNPRVVLLDEPFSALDVTLRRRMQGLLSRIWAEMGTTMIMVTHNIEEAITVGHRVVVLGNQPADILLDVRTDCKAYHDRYNPAFLSLQKKIEDLIDT